MLILEIWAVIVRRARNLFVIEVKGFFPEKAYQAEKEALLPGLQYPAVWLLGVLDCRQMSVDTRRYLQSFATINQPFTLAFDAKVFDTALNLHLVGWLKALPLFWTLLCNSTAKWTNDE